MPLIVAVAGVAMVHPVPPVLVTAYVIPVLPDDVAALKLNDEGVV
jgi:hypothetical protein